MTIFASNLLKVARLSLRNLTPSITAKCKYSVEATGDEVLFERLEGNQAGISVLPLINVLPLICICCCGDVVPTPTNAGKSCAEVWRIVIDGLLLPAPSIMLLATLFVRTAEEE